MERKTGTRIERAHKVLSSKKGASWSNHTPAAMHAKLSPTGKPTSIRHWICYHSYPVMGYEFFEIEGFRVFTSKNLDHLEGDIVWTIGRRGDTSRYYLDSRFRIDRVVSTANDDQLTLEADDGFVFVPECRIDGRKWFKHYKDALGSLSLGFQRIKDQTVLEGLGLEHARAKKFWNEL